MNLPIACTLTEAQLPERRQAITDTFRNVQVTTSELPDGYAFSFPASSEALERIAKLVDKERQCCPFLTFKIVVEAAHMRLEVTGAGEAKKVIAEYFAVRD
jgi:MerR family copper efflux transcriptional regulator